MTKTQKDMAVVNKQRNKSSTDNKQLQQMNTDNKFTHMNNINPTMLIFLCDLETKHRLLGLYIKYIHLMKDV